MLNINKVTNSIKYRQMSVITLVCHNKFELLIMHLRINVIVHFIFERFVYVRK